MEDFSSISNIHFLKPLEIVLSFHYFKFTLNQSHTLSLHVFNVFITISII